MDKTMMPLSAEKLKDALRDSRRDLLGTVVSTSDLVFAEQAASRFDLLWIDLEHSALSLRDAQALVIAAAAGGAFSLIRLPEADPRGIGAVLDTGANGVILPRVESMTELEAFEQALNFPPLGTRGFAPRRSLLAAGPPRIDGRPACVVQVESVSAVDLSSELAASGVCDALIVGTSDLSFDLGAPLVGDNPQLDNAVHKVRSAALAAGKGWGVAAGESPRRMRELAGRQGGTLVYGSDVRLFAKALDDLVDALRAGAA